MSPVSEVQARAEIPLISNDLSVAISTSGDKFSLFLFLTLLLKTVTLTAKSDVFVANPTRVCRVCSGDVTGQRDSCSVTVHHGDSESVCLFPSVCSREPLSPAGCDRLLVRLVPFPRRAPPHVQHGNHCQEHAEVRQCGAHGDGRR